MTEHAVARRVGSLHRAMWPFMEGILQFVEARQRSGARANDFTAGNPQELAMPAFVAALTRWSVPQDKDWFAYKLPDRRAQEAAAAGLSDRLGLHFEPQDIVLAHGAHGGLALALHAV